VHASEIAPSHFLVIANSLYIEADWCDDREVRCIVCD
jgi:hypothetical protein